MRGIIAEPQKDEIIFMAYKVFSYYLTFYFKKKEMYNLKSEAIWRANTCLCKQC